MVRFFAACKYSKFDNINISIFLLTEDTTPPVISGCPADITETTPLNSAGTVITWVVPTAVDNSLADPVVSVSQSPNTFFLTGDTVVTYTFADLAGNTANCAFTVRVVEGMCCSTYSTDPVQSQYIYVYPFGIFGIRASETWNNRK